MNSPISNPVHTVKLRFFEEEGSGIWGLAHAKTFDYGSDGEGFNAFWDGRGIFHDVFEHWFELEHPYFQGNYAMNVGGEMAAMGALWYYYDGLNVHDRQSKEAYQFGHYMGNTMRRVTEDLVKEAIDEGYCNFGQTLVSCIPNQEETENPELECQVESMWDNIKSHVRREECTVSNEYALQEQKRNRIFSKAYRKSVTLTKLRNLHRWGYRMAQELVPHTYENQQALSNFIEFWGNFCKNNKAEDIAQSCRYLEIRVWRDEENQISWKGYLIGEPGSGVHEMEVKEHFSVDDLMQAELEMSEN